MQDCELSGKVILITGGTGSFGQAFVKEALKYDVKAIRIYSRNEYLQWQMKQEFKDDRLRWMIGDVRDINRLRQCMPGVDYVVHAAALKHISTGQYNPQEVIKTNVLGAMNIIDLAPQCGVKKLLGISTDKVINPSNIYGASKMVMETVFRESNRWVMPGTMVSCARFGNFIESHGNVFELWAQQSVTGIITLTSEDMMRYFIHTEEAAKFALECLEIMQGNEVFIPKMTEYKILDLAKKNYPNCRIKVIGKYEGERHREPLFAPDEKVHDMGDYWVIEANNSQPEYFIAGGYFGET